MISNQLLQGQKQNITRAILARDYGMQFAEEVSNATPVKEGGVILGYKVRKRRWKQRIRINALRRPEVQRWACYKYQDAPPPPVEARRLAIVLASIALNDDEAKYQVDRWGVTLSEGERADIVRSAWAGGQAQYLEADEVGNLLGLTEVERNGLRIRTFGWAGSTKRSRTLASKARDRDYRRAKREREAAERANVAGFVGHLLRVDTADTSATFRVRAALKGGARSIPDLCELTGLDHRELRPILSRMKTKGEASNPKRGTWALATNAGGPKPAAAQPLRKVVRCVDGLRSVSVKARAAGETAEGGSGPATRTHDGPSQNPSALATVHLRAPIKGTCGGLQAAQARWECDLWGT